MGGGRRSLPWRERGLKQQKPPRRLHHEDGVLFTGVWIETRAAAVASSAGELVFFAVTWAELGLVVVMQFEGKALLSWGIV